MLLKCLTTLLPCAAPGTRWLRSNSKTLPGVRTGRSFDVIVCRVRRRLTVLRYSHHVGHHFRRLKVSERTKMDGSVRRAFFSSALRSPSHLLLARFLRDTFWDRNHIVLMMSLARRLAVRPSEGIVNRKPTLLPFHQKGSCFLVSD